MATIGCLVFFIFLLTVVVCFWGDGQQFQAYAVRRRISKGMTLSQVVFELGLEVETGALMKRNGKKRSDGSWFCYLVRPGLGQMLLPQTETTILFTAEDRVLHIEGVWWYRRNRQGYCCIMTESP